MMGSGFLALLCAWFIALGFLLLSLAVFPVVDLLLGRWLRWLKKRYGDF